MFCRMKRRVPSLFPSSSAAAPAKADRKKTQKTTAAAGPGGRCGGGGGGFLHRALRACTPQRRRAGGGRGRGLQVASDDAFGPSDYLRPSADMEKQWLIETDESDGARDLEGRGLVRAAAPPAH